MFMCIKYVCIRRFWLLFTKINHGIFSPPLVARNKKPRFSIGKYQPLKRESVNSEITPRRCTDIRAQKATGCWNSQNRRIGKEITQQTRNCTEAKMKSFVKLTLFMLWQPWDISGGLPSDFKAVDYLYNTVVMWPTTTSLMDGGIIVAFVVSMQPVCNLQSGSLQNIDSSSKDPVKLGHGPVF